MGKGLLGFLFGGLGGLLVGFILGVAVMALFGFMVTGGVNVPYDTKHLEIAGKVQVQVAGKNCELKHVSTGSAPFNPQSVVDIWKFAKGGTFTHSTWLFVQDGNTQVVMTVIGPPENSTTYILEFGRLTFQAVQLSIIDTSGKVFSVSWAANTKDGYAVTDLSFP